MWRDINQTWSCHIGSSLLFLVRFSPRKFQASFCDFSVDSKTKKEVHVKARFVYVAYHTKNTFAHDSETQIARVNNITLHPQFAPKHVSYDVSILSLSEELTLTSGLDIRLPTKPPEMSEDCVLSGFGKLYDVRSNCLWSEYYSNSSSERTFGWNHGNSWLNSCRLPGIWNIGLESFNMCSRRH